MSGAAFRAERRLQRIFGIALATTAACSAPLDPPAAEEVSEADEALVSEAGNSTCSPKQFTPDPPDHCGKFVHLACGLPPEIKPVSNCYLWLNDCKKVCPGAYFNCHATEAYCKDGKIVPDAKGNVDIDCVTCAKGIGRIPAGLAPSKMERAGSAVGDWLASAAYLEAAAVRAFVRLGRDLAAHGAPRDLVRAARDAARDEVRHARVMRGLAARFGGAPSKVRVAEPPHRPFAEIALENAVEGCVRETYGALFARFQAENAADPEIAEAMETIAADETRHAALSWAIAEWAEPKLDDEARARIREQRREAVEALRNEAGVKVAEELSRAAGMPDRDQQEALIGALEEGLWGPS